MNVTDFFTKAIAVAIDHDPRGKDMVVAELAQLKKEHDEMKPKEKDLFDTDRLANPYADSRILAGNPDTEVKSILVGIDIDVGELLLAQTLKSRGVPIDLVVSHHTSGRAFSNLAAVMPMQADILSRAGCRSILPRTLWTGASRKWSDGCCRSTTTALRMQRACSISRSAVCILPLTIWFHRTFKSIVMKRDRILLKILSIFSWKYRNITMRQG